MVYTALKNAALLLCMVSTLMMASSPSALAQTATDVPPEDIAYPPDLNPDPNSIGTGDIVSTRTCVLKNKVPDRDATGKLTGGGKADCVRTAPAPATTLMKGFTCGKFGPLSLAGSCLAQCNAACKGASLDSTDPNGAPTGLGGYR